MDRMLLSRVFSMDFLLMVLVVSIAVNVGLLIRYEGQIGREESAADGLPNRGGLCLAGKNRGPSPMEDKAHFSAKNLLPSPESESDSEAENGGEILINLDHGDPTMYEEVWIQMGDETSVLIPGWQYTSYFSDALNPCWFLQPEFAKAIIRLHKLVGNAVTEGRYIVVGTGSTQLFEAALYALSKPKPSEPLSVVSAAPYYSSYPLATDLLESGRFRWAGDARTFAKDKPYIELVTSPNNPDGFSRQAVVNGSEGVLIHDLAYYWPQYTPISSAADHDLMLFTISKSTGHAGMRLGWALVKDPNVAKTMTKFIEISSIGVSKDSQLRATKILQVIADSYQNASKSEEGKLFFEYSYHLMAKRWQQLRSAVNQSELFSLPDYPLGFCQFTHRTFERQPAFAWLKCEGGIRDCESFLRGHKILTRGGKHFGAGEEYVRISMLERTKIFNIFRQRLSKIQDHSPL